MNLTCPYCQTSIKYNPALAGRSVTCSYCNRPLLMPHSNALPPDQQEEYRREVEKAHRKQEAENRKKEEAERRRQLAEEAQEQAEADRLVRDKQRSEESRQRAAAEQERQVAEQAWNARVKAVMNVVPEENAVKNRYPAIQTYAGVVKGVTIVTIFVSILGWLVAAAAVQSGPFAVGLFIAIAIIDAHLWMFNFAFAEMLLLAIDVANDLRINRYLLKAMRYRDSAPQSDSRRPMVPPPPPQSPTQDGDIVNIV
jgi:cation transport ATPase